MKKLIVILLLSHFLSAHAQLNLNFEYWSKVQTINSPADWFTINIFGSFGDSVSYIQTKEAMIAVIKKVAPEVLGVLLAAWALYVFGDCMGWWGIAQYDHDFGNVVVQNSYIKCEE